MDIQKARNMASEASARKSVSSVINRTGHLPTPQSDRQLAPWSTKIIGQVFTLLHNLNFVKDLPIFSLVSKPSTGMHTLTLHPLNWHILRWLVAMVVILVLMAVSGCGEEQVVKFDTFLDELDVDASLESAEEINLGTYNVASALPLPESHSANDDQEHEAEIFWVQVHFELFAIVAPEDKKSVVAACERHRGMLDDTVVTICREASKEELDDSRWATLKSRLIDGIRPILGDGRVRQLSFSDFGWGPI